MGSSAVSRLSVNSGLRRPLALVATLVVLLLALPSAAGATGLSWSSPVQVDALMPAAGGPTITGVACPSANLCVATDGNGNVLVSTKPAVRGSWLRLQVDPGVWIDGIQCSSASLCYGFDNHGNVLISTDPAAGAGSWQVHRLGALQQLACPSASLCVADDTSGNVFVSTDPAAATPTWTHGIPAVGARLYQLLCPSTSLCLATGSKPTSPYQTVLAISTDPAAGPGSWTVDSGFPATGRLLSCPSTSACFAATQGGLAYSTDPAAGSWTTVSGTVNAKACPTANLCVGIDGHAVETMQNPTSPGSQWHLERSYTPRPAYVGMHVSCSPDLACVGFVGGYSVFASGDPTGGAGAWGNLKLLKPAGCDYWWMNGDCHQAQPVSSCGGTSVCVIGTGGGDLYATTRPADAGALHAVFADGGAPGIGGLSCGRLHICAGVDWGGRVLVSTRPRARASGWKVFTRQVGAETVGCAPSRLCLVAESNPYSFTSRLAVVSGRSRRLRQTSTHLPWVEQLACASRKVCLATTDPSPVTGESNLMVSSNPAGAHSKWHLVKGLEASGGIACPSARLCVAVRSSRRIGRKLEPGRVYVSSRPAAGARAWHAAALLRAFVGAVACPTTKLCVVLGYGGNVFVSHNPAGRARSWRRVHLKGYVKGGPSLACSTGSLCVAVDGAGNVFTSTHPAVARSWHSHRPFGHLLVTSAACPTARRCLVTGAQGSIVAIRKPR